MDIIQVIVVGIILVLGFLWQGWLINRDKHSLGGMGLRMKFAIPIAIIISVGTIGVCAIKVYGDSRNPISLETAEDYCIRAVVLSAAIILKSYFSPIVIAMTLAYTAYSYLAYSDTTLIDFLRPAIDWVFRDFPGYVRTCYLVAYAFIVLVGAIIRDSFIDLGH